MHEIFVYTFLAALEILSARGYDDKIWTRNDNISSPKTRSNVQVVQPLYTFNQQFQYEQQLYHDLFENYASNVIPMNPDAVMVNLQLYFIQLVSLDQVNQLMTVSVWLVQNWKDMRLTWDPAEYNGIDQFRVNPTDIWIPDLTLYNSADGKFQYAEELESQVMVRIYSDGTIRWTPLVVYTATCRMHLKYFPFDVQLCYLQFGSWVHDQSRLDITLTSNSSNLDEFVENHVWYVSEVPSRKNVKTYSSSSDVSYVDVQFFFILTRNFDKYVMNILLPCIVFGILCSMSFYVPYDSGERLTLSLSILIAIAVYQVLVADLVPKSTDQTPVLTIFLTVLIVLVVVSVILTTLILRIYTSKFEQPPGEFLTKLVLEKLGPKIVPDNHGLIAKVKFQKEHFDLTEGYLCDMEDLDKIANLNLAHNKVGIVKTTVGQINISHKSDEQYEDQKRIIKITKKKRKKIIANQWKLVAMMIDRICMIIYFVTLLVVTIWCLSYSGYQPQQVRDYMSGLNLS